MKKTFIVFCLAAVGFLGGCGSAPSTALAPDPPGMDKQAAPADLSQIKAQEHEGQSRGQMPNGGQ